MRRSSLRSPTRYPRVSLALFASRCRLPSFDSATGRDGAAAGGAAAAGARAAACCQWRSVASATSLSETKRVPFVCAALDYPPRAPGRPSLCWQVELSSEEKVTAAKEQGRAQAASEMKAVQEELQRLQLRRNADAEAARKVLTARA